MADILLTFGIDVDNTDTSAIEKQIESVISKLKVPKIKVEFDLDQNALKDIKQTLSQLQHSKGFGGGNVNAGGRSFTRIAAAYTSMMRTINSNRGRLNAPDMTALEKHASKLGEVLDNVSNKGLTMGKALKLAGIKGNAAIKESRGLLAKFNAEKQSAIKTSNESTKALTREEDLLVKIIKLRGQVTKNASNWTAASKGETADDFTRYLTLRDQIDQLYKNAIDPSNTQNRPQIAADLKKYKTEAEALEGIFRGDGVNHKSFLDRFKGLAAKFGSWLSVSQIVMQGVRSVKSMINSVTELDTAMTELKKVTNETDSTYNAFLARASERTKVLGASLPDTVNATADFARLGYSLKEAEQLADTAIIYKNVGDGIDNISESSESIIGTMQAFGIAAKDSMQIVDKYNAVGNNYAISSKGVGEAMVRSAAAMKAANNTIDESIALATAANTIAQDPTKVGTTLKTVSMFLRAAKTEASEAGESTDGMASSVSKLRGEILSLTGNKVDIQLDEYTYKSTYQILKELAGVWHELSDIAQANILERLGGKRNANIVSGLLQNFDVAERALNTSLNSAGSAMQENEKYLSSIKGQLNVVKATFQDLGRNLISSGLVKFVVGSGGVILGIVNGVVKLTNALGGLKTILLGVGAALMTFKGASIYHRITDMIAGTEKAKGLIGKITDLFTGISPTSKALGGGIAAIAGVVAVYSLIRRRAEEQSQAIKENAANATEASNQISSLITKYDALAAQSNNSAESRQAFTDTQNELIDKLGLEASQVDNLVNKYGSYAAALKMAAAAELKEKSSDIRAGADEYKESVIKKGQRSFESSATDGPTMSGVIYDLNDENKRALDALSKAGFKSGYGYGTGFFNWGDGEFDLDGILGAYDQIAEQMDVVREKVGTNNDVYAKLQSKYTELTPEVTEYRKAIESANDSLMNSILLEKQATSVLPKNKAEFDKYRQELLNSAKNNMGADGFAGTYKDIETAVDKALKATGDLAQYYKSPTLKEQLNSVHRPIVRNAQVAADYFKSAKNDSQVFVEDIGKLKEVIKEQNAGRTLTPDNIEKFNDVGLKDYRAALELVNGAMQINTDKVREIIKAKAEEQIANNNVAKSMTQDAYLKNIKEIERYQNKLKSASFEGVETPQSIRAQITRLQSENEALANTSRHYDALAASLREASGAYSNWLNALESGDHGDMAQDAIGAVDRIRNTYNAKSDIAGHFGSKKFSAAVEFIIPETVDPHDRAAIEQYINSFKEYLVLDEDNATKKFNTEKFIAASIEEGLIESVGTDAWQIVGQKSMEDFAKGLKLSVGVVRAMFDQLTLEGNSINWGAESVHTVGDLAIKANDAATALEKVDAYKNFSIKMNFEEIETVEEKEAAIKSLDQTIANMEEVKKLNLNTDDVNRANSIIQYCNLQKQLLTVPAIMKVDTSDLSLAQAGLAEFIGALQDFQNGYNDYLAVKVVGADTTEAEAKLDSLLGKVKEIAGQNPQIATALSIDTSSVSNLQSSIQNISSEKLIPFGVDSSKVDGYKVPNQEPSATYKPDTSLLPTYFTPITRYVNYVAIGDVSGGTGVKSSNATTTSVLGSMSLFKKRSGIAKATGTAMASGDWGTAKGGKTLVGELGREIVVDPRSGKWYTVGDNGAEFRYIPEGAIVFNHKQTEDLLSDGYVSSRAQALVKGTALVSGSGSRYTLTSAWDDTTTNTKKSRKKSSSRRTSSGGRRYSAPSKSNGKAAAKSKDTDKAESEFERLYKYHKHLVEMTAEDTVDFLNWLDGAYKNAYEQGEIELSDYYNYAEEVYKGLQNIFKDYISDVEHEIAMRENFDLESAKIISLYKNLMRDVSEEIDKARESGLDNADDYIQELQKSWMGYANGIKKIYEEIEKNAESALDKLIDTQKDILKQDIEDQKDGLDKKLDQLKDFYDKQKKLLQDERDEEKYKEDQYEKRKDVTDVQNQLSQLANDDSAWAQKRKAELNQELSDANKELTNFEKDHALDMALDALEKAYDEQEAKIKKEMDALSAVLDNPETLYNKALAAIQQNTGQLYEQMLAYNRKHGSGNDDDVKDVYEEAYKSLLEYKNLHGKDYKGVKLTNDTGFKPNTSWNTAPVSAGGHSQAHTESKKSSGSSSSNSSSGSTSVTDAMKRSVAAAIWRGTYGWGTGSTREKRLTEVFGSGNGIQALVNQGVGRYASDPGSSYSYANMRKKIKGYAVGTPNATSGLHMIDEYGSETIFESVNGQKYKMFSGGEKVLTSRASDFLYKFATSGGEFILKLFGDLGGAVRDTISPVVYNNSISMGDIIVQGPADGRTVSAIRREQRSAVEYMLKELNRLNK